MINSYSELWRIDPSKLQQPKGKKRQIGGGPVIDLNGLQAYLSSPGLDLDAIWVATGTCERDLENYRWTYEDIVQMLICLTVNDFDKSEWCDVQGQSSFPCDVYVMPFDNIRRQRSTKGFEVYIKFSLAIDGALTLVLVSCHAPR